MDFDCLIYLRTLLGLVRPLHRGTFLVDEFGYAMNTGLFYIQPAHNRMMCRSTDPDTTARTRAEQLSSNDVPLSGCQASSIVEFENDEPTDPGIGPPSLPSLQLDQTVRALCYFCVRSADCIVLTGGQKCCGRCYSQATSDQ